MKTYLIQRGKFENRDYKSGIDSIIKFDYMGSAEFEFGALPNSLKNIRENINDYIYQDILINKKIITVFYNKKFKNDIVEFLTKLSEDKMTLKEWTDFRSYIYDDSTYGGTDFWWDIENHLMFWKSDNENQNSFTEKFKELIKANTN